MSRSDADRRGRHSTRDLWHENSLRKFLGRRDNRRQRAAARRALRRGDEPAPEQTRHSARWDLW
jgi:hypothetical protein